MYVCCVLYIRVCLSVGGFISELREPRYISLCLSPASIHTGGVYHDISFFQLTIIRKAIYYQRASTDWHFIRKENVLLDI